MVVPHTLRNFSLALVVSHTLRIFSLALVVSHTLRIFSVALVVSHTLTPVHTNPFKLSRRALRRKANHRSI